MINTLLCWLFAGSHFRVRLVVICPNREIKVAVRQRSRVNVFVVFVLAYWIIA